MNVLVLHPPGGSLLYSASVRRTVGLILIPILTSLDEL